MWLHLTMVEVVSSKETTSPVSRLLSEDLFQTKSCPHTGGCRRSVANNAIKLPPCAREDRKSQDYPWNQMWMEEDLI
ncbi:unnamed protein product [Hermetia illucens]|uniref:Uncharacterized protein n=1 Tax=Hermetia illucens TaxID=343691 RepID=A0A7R8UPK3_HERIL|nr:unnamed protein product [Hermetia illucens]